MISTMRKLHYMHELELVLYIHIHFEYAEVSLIEPFGFCDLAGCDGDDLVEDTFSCCLQCFFSIHDFTHVHVDDISHGDIRVSIGGDFDDRCDW